MTRTALLLLALGVALPAAAGDLDGVKAEPNPEKRSERALDAAERSLEALSTAYNAGETKAAAESEARTLEAVALALESLEASGKNPHASKYYKRAEIRTRSLSRRAADFAESASVDDRPQFLKLRDQVQAVHDKLLDEILLRKKK